MHIASAGNCTRPHHIALRYCFAHLAFFSWCSAQMGTLEKARLNFDGTRREFNKLELKRVRQQQAKDAVEPELASQLSAKQVSLDGELGRAA